MNKFSCIPWYGVEPGKDNIRVILNDEHKILLRMACLHRINAKMNQKNKMLY